MISELEMFCNNRKASTICAVCIFHASASEGMKSRAGNLLTSYCISLGDAAVQVSYRAHSWGQLIVNIEGGCKK